MTGGSARTATTAPCSPSSRSTPRRPRCTPRPRRACPAAAAPALLDEIRAQLRGTVAHAAWVERSFLDRVRAGRERLPKQLLDTAWLRAQAGVRGPRPAVPRLEALAEDLGSPVHTLHHALGDADGAGLPGAVQPARGRAARAAHGAEPGGPV
ncbi:MAG: hypothetical protein R2731_14415 [Nocardioides sp.]